ncbi:hypothetical protein Nepgr_019920 [Nepenthes gracilis]|uniref:Serine aminopeptidase S33 domain-containing protein n=1 Tax=Nepenthes gracilis TaxID=150966 RepID=A0AAD3SWP6_NEPGR|nr:hypothetical protein Nepgr_019920 [Nepenthes gracilis]
MQASIPNTCHPELSNPCTISRNHRSATFPADKQEGLSFPLTRSYIRALAMAQNPVIQPQKVIIPNDRGERLVGLLHDARSKEVVILCHGFSATKGHKIMVNLASALEKEGISAFRFDFSGNGESDGSFAYANYMGEAEDLHAVVKYFTGADRVVSAVVGHSKGGTVVLLYASKYHDIHTVVNLSGRCQLDRGIEKNLGENFVERIKNDGFIDVKNKAGEVIFRVTEKDLVERLNTNMHDACLKINKECRVLTIHGSADETIPVQDAHEFSKIIPNHKLHIIEGADHCYSSHQAELASAVSEFIKECLKQDKEASV